MKISTIEDPNSEESKPIEDGITEYGLSQVNGIAPKKWAFHAVEAGEIVGGAIGRVHFSQFYLDNIWVKEEFRSEGLGTKIHESVVACAKQCACQRIQLNTLNEKAIGFYTRLNYEILATIEGYVDGFNLYYMAKKI